MALVEEPKGWVVVVVQIKKRGFPIPVPVNYLARSNMHAASVEGVDILRISGSTVVIHSHATGQEHGDGGAVITAPFDRGIHLVKKLAKSL
jgi:hypothetical protein